MVMERCQEWKSARPVRRSVTSYRLGKDQRVDIHHLSWSSLLVKIPSAKIREAVVEQELCYIAGTVGEPRAYKPIESINSVDVKVEVDLTKDLPTEVEIELEDGTVDTIDALYRWIPPKCNMCKEFGHVEKFCSKRTTQPLEPNANRILAKLGEDWSRLDNYQESNLGRIWVLFRGEASAQLLKRTANEITVEMTVQGWLPFILSAIYAPNQVADRDALWSQLLQTHQQFVQPRGGAWILGGDFNEILGGDFNEILLLAQHSAPSFSHQTPTMTRFANFLYTLGLHDLPYRGSLFTWTNKQVLNPIAKKLDRVLVNNSWRLLFPDSSAIFRPPHPSDHCPSLVRLSRQLLSSPKPFKIFNFVLDHPDFLPTIQTSWSMAGRNATTLSAFYRKQRKSILARRSRNFISYIRNHDGSRLEKLEEIAAAAVDFYTNILGREHHSGSIASIMDIQRLLENGQTTMSLNQNMHFTEEDIRRVTFSMALNKTPGPDGFMAEYYRRAWSIVGGEFTTSILHFLQTRRNA
ncbi:PREDICTED: uncharacterized protein LOC104825777 [Tarenaya hassleriana]|uniref:uncharacterized protein LOC104825777 n=1 Tax=Tarenaya hassleriana TaxID=28532 RepID=UPI00053C35FF|nr:PREDICTED: uncharacterized protein LOC104825777 [Tarenaya hassleriana]